MELHSSGDLRDSHQHDAIRNSGSYDGLACSDRLCSLLTAGIYHEWSCCSSSICKCEGEVKSLKEEQLSVTPIKTLRDVLVFTLGKRRVTVVGCDSSGGIGPKFMDVVRVDGYTLGKFTARVALMEVLSTGAKPICVVNTLCVEPKPTGFQIAEGIRDEARRARVSSKFAVTGSSEKNIPVRQTGLGVTVIGIAMRRELRMGGSKRKDSVISIGIPLVGNEVLLGGKRGLVADTNDLLKLLNLGFIHEVIPVGSQGIMHEAEIIAKESHLRFELADRPMVDVRKSAGPATVILATLPEVQLSRLRSKISKPINMVGCLL